MFFFKTLSNTILEIFPWHFYVLSDIIYVLFVIHNILNKDFYILCTIFAIFEYCNLMKIYYFVLYYIISIFVSFSLFILSIFLRIKFIFDIFGLTIFQIHLEVLLSIFYTITNSFIV